MAKRDETLRLDKIFDSGHPSFNLARFGWEINELRNCTTFEAGWRSLGCALTGWQMHEWFWKLSDEAAQARMVDWLGQGHIANTKSFGLAMQRHDHAIAICRQIGTVAKHLSVDHSLDHIRTTFNLGDGKDGDPEGHFVQIWVHGEPHRDAEVYGCAFKTWMDLYVEAQLRDWERVGEAVRHLREQD